ncbi:MAG: hypothetical protein V1735_07380 [Nanoarchaeota archaeon]
MPPLRIIYTPDATPFYREEIERESPLPSCLAQRCGQREGYGRLKGATGTLPPRVGVISPNLFDRLYYSQKTKDHFIEAGLIPSTTYLPLEFSRSVLSFRGEDSDMQKVSLISRLIGETSGMLPVGKPPHTGIHLLAAFAEALPFWGVTRRVTSELVAYMETRIPPGTPGRGQLLSEARQARRHIFQTP